MHNLLSLAAIAAIAALGTCWLAAASADPVGTGMLAEYQSACNGGEAGACFNLGHMYAHGEGVTKDLVKAAEFYSKACDSGDAGGCANLGFMYAHGEGVAKDYVRKPSRCIRKAATLGI